MYFFIHWNTTLPPLYFIFTKLKCQNIYKCRFLKNDIFDSDTENSWMHLYICIFKLNSLKYIVLGALEHLFDHSHLGKLIYCLLKNVSLETHSTYFTCHNKVKRHKLATFQDKKKPIHIKIFFMVENIAWSNGVLFRLLLLQMNVAFFFLPQECNGTIFISWPHTAQQTLI